MYRHRNDFSITLIFGLYVSCGSQYKMNSFYSMANIYNTYPFNRVKPQQFVDNDLKKQDNMIQIKLGKSVLNTCLRLKSTF